MSRFARDNQRGLYNYTPWEQINAFSLVQRRRNKITRRNELKIELILKLLTWQIEAKVNLSSGWISNIDCLIFIFSLALNAVGGRDEEAFLFFFQDTQTEIELENFKWTSQILELMLQHARIVFAACSYVLMSNVRSLLFRFSLRIQKRNLSLE